MLKVYYVAGGYNGWEALDSVEILGKWDTVWTEIHPLPVPLQKTSGLAFEENFYVFGRN